MAKLNSTLLQGISGTVGKQLVFKNYGDKTVVTKYPNMKDIKPSERQKERRKLLTEAARYASAISRNPEQKNAYQEKIPAGKSVYHHALQEYLANHRK